MTFIELSLRPYELTPIFFIRVNLRSFAVHPCLVTARPS